MEVNGVDQPGKRKLRKHIGELIRRELLKGARHRSLHAELNNRSQHPDSPPTYDPFQLGRVIVITLNFPFGRKIRRQA
jgi:hypothetical protein